jgi:hypothetical protein
MARISESNVALIVGASRQGDRDAHKSARVYHPILPR